MNSSIYLMNWEYKIMAKGTTNNIALITISNILNQFYKNTWFNGWVIYLSSSIFKWRNPWQSVLQIVLANSCLTGKPNSVYKWTNNQFCLFLLLKVIKCFINWKFCSQKNKIYGHYFSESMNTIFHNQIGVTDGGSYWWVWGGRIKMERMDS